MLFKTNPQRSLQSVAATIGLALTIFSAQSVSATEIQEVEPNNSLGTAQIIPETIPIQFGPTYLAINGKIRNPSESDFYRLTGNIEGSQIVFTLDQLKNGGTVCARMHYQTTGFSYTSCEPGLPAHWTIIMDPGVTIEIFQPSREKRGISYRISLSGITLNP